ncbi:MAG: hypothetical protein FJ038_14085 [Chloroflexi bacterium]|nr:hypothetical protein [Chloroflexota bacterium]
MDPWIPRFQLAATSYRWSPEPTRTDASSAGGGRPPCNGRVAGRHAGRRVRPTPGQADAGSGRRRIRAAECPSGSHCSSPAAGRRPRR